MAREIQPIPTPWPQRVADFRQRTLPLLVWCVAALVGAWLLVERGARTEYLGLARSLDYEVSAPVTARLDSVLVDVYDEVEAGQIVARLDDPELEARIERSHAQIRQLTAELHAAKEQLLATNSRGRAGWTNDLRRFQTDEEGRRLSVLELRSVKESGEIEEQRLALELERAKPLLSSGLIGASEYDAIRLAHDEVRSRNEETRNLLDQTEQEFLAAQARRREFEASLPSFPAEEPLLRPLRAAIDVESQRLAEVEARRSALALRSPVRGQVSAILCRGGQTVVPGEPILTVSDPAVREIVTFLAENDRRVVARNSLVTLASLGRPERIAESVVVRTGPQLEVLPRRLWRDPRVPDYGRAVVIAATPGLELLPGEMLRVRFLDGR